MEQKSPDSASDCEMPPTAMPPPLAVPDPDSEELQEIEPLQKQPTKENEQFQEEFDEDGSSDSSRFIVIDSPKSWIVAFACAWITFWTMLINRSSGLMYVSLCKELDMTREEAAAPFSISGAVSNIFGIISGILVRELKLLKASVLGVVLCSAGILLAGGFYTKISITYCIGIITAIGQSLILMTSMVVVNTYFDKHKSTASGLSYTGATLVSFLMPFAYKEVQRDLGLQLTILIIGVLTLCALLGCIVLRYPPIRAAQNNNNNNNPCSEEEKKKPNAISDTSKPFIEQLGFLKRPIFYFMVISGIVFAYVLVLFNVTVVAFASEKLFKHDHTLITLWFYAAGDLTGRLFSGQLSDRGLLRRRSVMAIGFFTTSIAILGLALSEHPIAYFACCLLYGLSAGSMLILFSILYNEYLGAANIPMTMGVHCLFNGLASLPRQRLIKYLTQGQSYRPLYYFLTAVSVIMSIAWSCHCIYLKIQDRRRAEDPSTTRNTPQSPKTIQENSDIETTKA